MLYVEQRVSVWVEPNRPARVRIRSFMTPRTQRFFEEWYSLSMENPVGGGRGFHMCLIELRASASDDDVNLHGLRSIAARRGYGTKALSQLTRLADLHGVGLWLTAERYARRSIQDGLTNAQLQRWYPKFGFVPESRGSTRMYRQPQPTDREPLIPHRYIDIFDMMKAHKYGHE